MKGKRVKERGFKLLKPLDREACIISRGKNLKRKKHHWTLKKEREREFSERGGRRAR